eukprot:6712093-Lingulodinium_polyedra.AAC.1
MTTLVQENPEMGTAEALARATAAGNAREDVRGHSPLQHALGRAPDLDGRFYETDFDEMQRVDLDFGQDFEKRLAAEQAYLRQVYQRRVNRAEHAKSQALQLAVPGMWVRYFRRDKGEMKG